MLNKYTGDVDLKMGGKDFTIAIDWKAIAEIHSLHGPKILREIYESPITTICDIIAVALKKHHPEMTSAMVMELSPPFIPTLAALDKAVTYAYFGGEQLPTLPEERAEPLPAKKKKNLLATIFGKR